MQGVGPLALGPLVHLRHSHVAKGGMVTGPPVSAPVPSNLGLGRSVGFRSELAERKLAGCACWGGQGHFQLWVFTGVEIMYTYIYIYIVYNIYIYIYAILPYKCVLVAHRHLETPLRFGAHEPWGIGHRIPANG